MTTTRQSTINLGTLINIGLIIFSFVISTVYGLWLISGILDQSYISRTLIMVFVSVLLVINIVLYITSTLVYVRFINVKYGMLTAFHSTYYLTCITLGIIEVFIIAFFFLASRDIDTVDSSTFVDPDNFTSILVYRDIITLLIAFWAIRLQGFINSLIQAISDDDDDVRRSLTRRNNK